MIRLPITTILLCIVLFVSNTMIVFAAPDYDDYQVYAETLNAYVRKSPKEQWRNRILLL